MKLARIISLILTVLASLTGFCGKDLPIFLGSFKSMKQLEHGVLITAENAKVEVLHFSPTVIRIRVSRSELQPDFSYAVIQQPAGNFREIGNKKDSVVLIR
jgi:alpha-glucosidase